MHVLRGLRGEQARQRLPELRRRFRGAPDPARERMAAGRMRHQARAVGQARTSEICDGRHRSALRAAEGCAAGRAIVIYPVIARSEATKQPTVSAETVWIASLRSQ